MKGLRPADIDAIRRGERAACVEEIRRMAHEANRQGYGITYEGGIDAQDCARIMEACAREIESAFVAEAEQKTIPDLNKMFIPSGQRTHIRK